MSVHQHSTESRRTTRIAVGLLILGTVIAPLSAFALYLGAFDSWGSTIRLIVGFALLLLMFAAIPSGLMIGARGNRRRGKELHD